MNWKTPQAAPRDGTIILADFGWPYAVIASWNGCNNNWAIATHQVQPVDGEWNDFYFETDWESDSDLKQWMEMPSLSNAQGEARR